MAPVNPPLALQANASKHPAQLFRQALSSLINAAGGLVAAGGLALSQKSTGAEMFVIVKGGNPNEGACWVPGSVSPVTQGLYYCWNSANYEVPIVASGANPRVDTIVARVKDEQYEGAENEWLLEAVKGTEDPAATLANKKGIAALPKNALVIGYVLVPKSATGIVTADIENVATQFTLAAVTGAWQTLTPNSPLTAGTPVPECRFESGGAVVRLRGAFVLAAGSEQGEGPLATIPPSYRPAANVSVAGVITTLGAQRFAILTNGELLQEYSFEHGGTKLKGALQLSLEGITYSLT